jgi:DNA-binding transcriptional regulator LsrR (DeoR family)
MNSEQVATLTRLSIEGKPSRQIAAQIGVSHTTVSNTLNKPEVRSLVEAGFNKIVRRGLDPAVKTLCRAAALGNTKAATKDINLFKISVDASKSILSHVYQSGPSTIINTLIQVSESSQDSPQVMALQAAIEAQWEVKTDETIGIPPSHT